MILNCRRVALAYSEEKVIFGLHPRQSLRALPGVFFHGRGNIVKNPRIWIAPTLASAITGPLATCVFHFEMNGAAVSSGMGTCGLVGQIGVYTGWVSDIAAGTKAAITPMDWAAMVLLCFVLPAVLSVIFCEIERKLGWIKEGDLKLN
jgi:uncharacterized protein